MGFFTLRRLASLQKWFAITAFIEFGFVIWLNIFKHQLICQLDTPRPKDEVQRNRTYTFFLDCGNSSDASQIRDYESNQMLLWFILLLSAILNGLLWAGFLVTRDQKLANEKRPNDSQSTSKCGAEAPQKNSGFTRAATLVYVIISFLCLILTFVLFQFKVSGGRFASFAIAWLQNFSNGKPLLARRITDCVFRGFEPMEELPVTCKLLMNSHFEFIYLVFWFWFVLLAVVNLLVLLQYLLFNFSSTLRLKRLSALLKGVDKQKISELAQDADAFFKIECYADETVKLKG